MKRLITTLFLTFTLFAQAQYPDTTPGDKEIREKAKKLTYIYDQKLGLDSDQILIFQDKVEDYLVLSERAQEQFEGREELDVLTELMVKETLEMQDILTRPQYIEYRKIRQSIQPIKEVPNQ